MNDLKKKCLALGEALYEVLSALPLHAAPTALAETAMEPEETAETKRRRGRPRYDKEAIAREEAKRAEVTQVTLPPGTELKIEYNAGVAANVAPEPEPVQEPEADPFAEETPVVTKRTAAELKQVMVTWYEADKGNRASKVLGILNKVTGVQKFAEVTDEIATSCWDKLVAELK